MSSENRNRYRHLWAELVAQTFTSATLKLHPSTTYTPSDVSTLYGFIALEASDGRRLRLELLPERISLVGVSDSSARRECMLLKLVADGYRVSALNSKEAYRSRGAAVDLQPTESTCEAATFILNQVHERLFEPAKEPTGSNGEDGPADGEVGAGDDRLETGGEPQTAGGRGAAGGPLHGSREHDPEDPHGPDAGLPWAGDG